jgi:hypothetical protein
LNAGVHALAACRAVNVRSVAAEQDVALARRLRHAMMDVKARTPGHVADASRSGDRATLVEHRLHEIPRRNFRRLFHSGDDAKTFVGKRRNNDKSLW